MRERTPADVGTSHADKSRPRWHCTDASEWKDESEDEQADKIRNPSSPALSCSSMHASLRIPTTWWIGFERQPRKIFFE